MRENKKGVIVKYYRLTPKAYRIAWALEEYEKAKKHWNKYTDEEILKLAKEEETEK